MGRHDGGRLIGGKAESGPTRQAAEAIFVLGEHLAIRGGGGAACIDGLLAQLDGKDEGTQAVRLAIQLPGQLTRTARMQISALQAQAQARIGA